MKLLSTPSRLRCAQNHWLDRVTLVMRWLVLLGVLAPLAASAQTPDADAKTSAVGATQVADTAPAASTAPVVATNAAISSDTTVTPELPPLQVSHVGSDSVYLNGGRSHGLSVGQIVSVVRDGEPIAELQVAFISKKSASCQVIDSRLEIVLGDQAIPVAVLEPPEATAEPAASASPPSVQTGMGRPSKSDRKVSTTPPPSVLGQKWADFSGTISLRWHHFEDGSELPRNFDQTTARLNLRTQSHDGTYEARLRVRGREDRRQRSSDTTETSRRDRLYELAFTYEPPDGQIFLEMGRMSSSPMLGFDYLDGVLAEYKFPRRGADDKSAPRYGIGGFYGQRSDIDDLGFGSEGGEAYGAFFHYQRKRSKESPFYADVILGGIRETFEGEVSREFLSVYARLGSGSRWSFYQRADIDINTDWRRDVAGDDYQVSNLLSSVNYRFSDSLRLGLSYDSRRRFREFENRDTPEEIFDDRLRQGFRLNAQIGNPRGWRLTSSVGVRSEEGAAEDAYTASGSVFHANLADRNLLLGLDFSGFSGETSEGYRVSLRTRKYFDGGHDIGLTLGTSTTTTTVGGLPVDSENQWIRLNGTARLPKRFFVLAELEVTEGDDLAGERLILQLGYRL